MADLLWARSPALRYSAYGAAFGLVFPLVATLLEMGLAGLPMSLGGFLAAQATQPLLWIIDSSPLLLGLFAQRLGRSQAEVETLQRDQANRRLGAEIDRFFTLYPDALAILAMDDLSPRRVNPGFTRLLGYGADELVGVTAVDLVIEDDRKDAARRAARMRQRHDLAGYEVRMRHKSGHSRWIQWRTMPVMEDGVIYAIGRDVTEAK